jgi:hypothetical protein
MLMVDEGHHLPAGSHREQRALLNLSKQRSHSKSIFPASAFARLTADQ